MAVAVHVPDVDEVHRTLRRLLARGGQEVTRQPEGARGAAEDREHPEPRALEVEREVGVPVAVDVAQAEHARVGRGVGHGPSSSQSVSARERPGRAAAAHDRGVRPPG